MEKELSYNSIFMYKYKNRINEYFINKQYLSGPTKCFDCEKQLDNKYLAKPTKCFDCEKEYIKYKKDPHLTQPTKCFDCEKELCRYK